MDGDLFENAPRVDADTFYIYTDNIFYTDKKKMRFQRYPDTCGRGLIDQHFSFEYRPRAIYSTGRQTSELFYPLCGIKRIFTDR